MTFEWDESKNQSNIKKHGLSFESARRVFLDPLAKVFPDLGSHNEERWKIIGRIGEALVVLTVFTIRDEDAEHYRIISARQVSTHERRSYEDR